MTFDPHMVILVVVDEVLEGESPFPPGEQVALLVHSPALMFGGYGFSGRQFVYEFAIFEHAGGGTSYSLTALDTWPRSRP